jgi:hypothetical protein
MAIDQALIDNLGAATLRGVLRQSDQADQAARDNAQYMMFDQRSLGAAIAREVAQAPDPATFADFNTAARIPTTVGHEIQSPNVPQPLPK